MKAVLKVEKKVGCLVVEMDVMLALKKVDY